MPNSCGILHFMEVMAIEHEPFALAVDDPYLSALIGTIEEPQGSSTAELAGRLTLSWWGALTPDRGHGVISVMPLP